MPSRLETLLELALRTSTANNDPYKDDLRYFIRSSFQLNVVKPNQSNPKDQSERRFTLSSANANSKWKHANCLRHGTTLLTQCLYFCIYFVERMVRVFCITEQRWGNPKHSRISFWYLKIALFVQWSVNKHFTGFARVPLPLLPFFFTLVKRDRNNGRRRFKECERQVVTLNVEK